MFLGIFKLLVHVIITECAQTFHFILPTSLFAPFREHLFATFLRFNHQTYNFRMSDLHKKLINRQKNESFGLAPLAEDPILDNEDSDTCFSSTDPDHKLDQSFYENAKNDTFPIRDVYIHKDGLYFQTYYSPPSSLDAPILVFHHGAGSSAMTFCWLAHFLKGLPEDEIPGIFLFDARGHGDSSKIPADFSLAAFSSDFAFVLQEFCTRHKVDTSIFLVGHSLGGAILTNYIMNFDHSHYKIIGLVMIDIVEETAVRALSSISHFINRRPKNFRSYPDAIQWHLNSHLLRNETSAKISVSALLQPNNSGYLDWKTDLSLMANFWDSWFVNLSENFIKCGSNSNSHLSKLLILSGNEILDKELIIGQMQGKYQLIVFNNSTNAGHFLQEDIPMQLGISITEFVRRNSVADKSSSKKLIRPKWGGEVNQ